MITITEARSLLEKGEYGVLSTVSPDGEPYGLPLNYCVIDGSIFFHGAREGRKIDNILGNPSVSFCVVGKWEVLPAEFATNYESCIVQGWASEVFGEEKALALEGLIAKYSPNHIAAGLQYQENFSSQTRVFKIAIQSLAGKARR